jgi:catechol 2,3-dioxygenase
MVHVPKTSWPPPFRVTRASHLTYNVRDLSRSREFYTQVLGLVVSDEDRDTLYLRGVEERSHHSLVLKRTSACRTAPSSPAEYPKHHMTRSRPIGSLRRCS